MLRDTVTYEIQAVYPVGATRPDVAASRPNTSTTAPEGATK